MEGPILELFGRLRLDDFVAATALAALPLALTWRLRAPSFGRRRRAV